MEVQIPIYKIFSGHLLAQTFDFGMIDASVLINWDGGPVKRVADKIHNGKDV